MNIAICSDSEEVDGIVPMTFKDSPFLMIIDADKSQVFKVYGKQDPENLVFARKVLEHDCEAVICGPLEKEAFNLLAFHGVTRYNGAGKKVQRAYYYAMSYRLEMLRDYIGGPGPFAHRHEGEACGEEDHSELFPDPEEYIAAEALGEAEKEQAGESDAGQADEPGTGENGEMK